MANPFDDENSLFYVLINAEGQHSLWPASIEIPAGWKVAHGPANKTKCVAFVEVNWTDLRPLSLVKEMAQAAGT